MKKRIITIEDLAHMVQKGFEETAKDADVEVRFEKLNGKLGGVDKKLDEIDTRLYNMEKDVAEIKRNFISRNEFEVLSDRVRILEKRVSAKLK